jgi:hypothetical protein
VFVGGFDLDALEAVCPGHDVPAGAAVTILAQLVDKSLVQVTAGGRRYRLLETIREYALERLSLDDDARAVLYRRDAHFVDLAERACAAFGTAANGGWFERLQQDVDNLRAVMSRAIAEREHATGLRLGAALSMFWRMRGYLGEGQGRLAEVVAAADESGEVERFPAALRELGILTGELSDHAAGKAHLDRYLARARPSGDGPGVAAALVSLGTWTTGEDLCEARRCLEEGLEVARACGDRLRVTVGLYKLALVAHLEGDQAMARSLVEESVARARDVGDDIHLAAGLVCRGRIEFDELRLNDASATWDEALRISMAGGSIWSLPTLLEGFARLSALRGGASVALRLAGASDALREVIGAPRTAIWYQDFDQRMDAAAGGAARSHPDWAAGRALPLDAAVDLAYTVCQSAPGQGG